MTEEEKVTVPTPHSLDGTEQSGAPTLRHAEPFVPGPKPFVLGPKDQGDQGPVEGLKNGQPLAERSDKERRATFMERVVLILLAVAIVAIIFYVLLYVQVGAWQALSGAGGLALTFVSLIMAYGLVRRGKLDAAGYWILFALLVGYAAAELFLAGATLYLTAGGILLIIIAGSVVLPRKWGAWLVTTGLFVTYTFLVNRFEPLPRYDVGQSMVLRIFIPGIAASLALAILWQIVRAFRVGTIRARLLVAFVTLVILLSSIFAVVGASLTYQALLRVGRDSLSSVADLKQREIERWVRERERDLDILVAEIALQQPLQTILGSPEGSIERLMAHSDLIVRLGAFRRKKVAFAELFMMDPETGEIVFSTSVRREGEAYPEAVYFGEGRKGPYLQPPAYDPVLNAPSMLIAWPMEGSDKEVLAVIVGRANLADLGLLIQAKAGLGRTGETYLVSAEGLYVAGSQDPSSVLEGALDSIGIRAALSGEAGMGQYINCRGEEVFGAYRWLPKMGVALLVEQSRSEAVGAALRQVVAMVVVTVVAAALASGVALFLTRRIVGPIVELTDAATRIAAGDLQRSVPVQQADEIGVLGRAFNSMTAQLRELIGGLEQRVTERTRALAYRSVQLETAAQVSEATGSLLDPLELEQQVVELIRQRFEYYYVGLFLVDESGEWTGEPGRWAVLLAGTGEAGQAMLDAGHKLEVGGTSMIGGCIAEGRARIALDVGVEAVCFENLLLPETRSEMALPLIARGKVIGAISVQSERETAFSEGDVSILQTMAAQVANAVANARLYDQAQKEVTERRRAEEELRESEEKYRTILENIEDGYYEVDIAGNFTFFNDSMCRLLGYPKDELMGMNNRQYMDGQNAKAVNQAFSQVYRTGKPIETFNWEFFRKDGSRRFADASVSLIRGATGEPIGFRGIIRDTTGRKRVEAERERLLAELERRALQLQTAFEISRAASSILEVDELLNTSVNLIRDRFDVYYVGLFLVDEGDQDAVLRAGSGEAGRQMLAQGHKLAVGSKSMIGWCTAHAQARVAQDVSEEVVRYVNPLLPETRSEIALPLFSRSRVIGAMTIQDSRAGAFSGEDISVLQTMADQLAGTIENARLFEQTQQALAEAETAYRRYLQREWGAFLRRPSAAQLLGFWDGPEGTIPISGAWSPQQEAAALAAPDGAEDEEQQRLAVPIKLRGQTIGTIDLYRADDGGEWSEGDQTLAGSLAEQLALAIENARLFEQTQYRARREQLIRRIADRIRRTTDLDTILQTAVMELGKALGTSHAAILLGTEAELGPPSVQSRSDEG